MTAMERSTQTNVLAQPTGDFNREQIDLIKATVAVGCTDLELALFLEVCKSTGLNPFLKQVYAIRRKTGREEKMTIQTGIDGYRLIAARTGTHLGTTDPEFGPNNKDGYPEWARVVARRLVHGHIAEFPAMARWSEYVQTKNEWKNGQATGNKTVSDMWARMPFTMLGKCAEALALRKAFPGELSGVYSDVEMQQADSEPTMKQDRGRNATAEVAEAAGVPVQINPDSDPERLAAAKERLLIVGTRLKAMGGTDTARDILRKHNWKTSVGACRLAYDELVELGKTLKAAQEAPVEAEVISTEGKISSGQRNALMAQLGRVGVEDKSETRSLFYSWFVSSIPSGTRTNNLSQEDAQGLIDALSALDNDEAKQTGAEFIKDIRL